MKKTVTHSGRNPFNAVLCAVLSLAIALSMGVFAGGAKAFAAENLGYQKHTTDYDSLEDVRDAMMELNEQIGAEGFVLLKNNDNTLPLAKNSKISLFGKNSVNPVLKGSGSSGSVGAGAVDVVQSLQNAGFKLNPALQTFYNDNAASGAARPDTGFSSYNYNSYFPTAETPQAKYTQTVKDSYADYSDAAVVVFSRTGGEGTDLPRSSFVKAEDEGKVPAVADARVFPTREQAENGGFVAYGGEGRVNTPYAHYLELDENEIDLIDEVTAQFSKVVVVLNSNNAMELSREKLIDNDKVQSILYAPGAGQNGLAALGKILKGEVNPSGRLADTFAADFTADPTWNNFGNNNVGYYGVGGTGNSYMTEDGLDYSNNFNAYNGIYEVSYDEGIYVGYKYYETRGYEEMRKAENNAYDWYDNAVNYPFGYGLSYTDFSMQLLSASPNDGASFSSGTDVTVKVKVTNTGKVSGKQVVQLYASAPYAEGKTEKPHVSLAAFAKTGLLKPGASEVVVLRFNAFDMASYDVYDKDNDSHKGYELDKGVYTLYVGENAHDAWAGDNVIKMTLSLDADINVDVDPATGAAIESRFDASNTEMENKSMSRSDFAGTFPARPLWYDVENDTTVDPLWLAERKSDNPSFDLATYTGEITYLKQGKAELVKSESWLHNFDMPLIDGATTANAVVNPAYDQGKPWYSATAPAFRAETEAYGAANPAPIQLSDMAGVAYGDAKWDTFVNQLTVNQSYDAMAATQFQFNAQAAIGAPAAGHSDGPLGLSGSWVGGGDSIIAPAGGGASAIKFLFATEACVACTWNTELAQKEGKLVGDMGLWTRTVGWYAPAANIHRSPFSGRNFEYYSEDGTLSAYMLAEVVKGARSKGMITFMKHFALNDQETNRDTNGIATWADEQTMREIYFKPFEWAVKKADSNGAMTSFNRIGFDWAGASYELLTELTRGEWGFEGVFITDAHSSGQGCMNANQMIRAGNDMSLDSAANSIARIVNSDEANTPTQLTALHNTMKNIYYTVVNSAAMRNGLGTGTIEYSAGNAYSSFAYTAGTAGNLGSFKAGDSVNVSVSDGDTAHKYVRVMGNLPDGLTLNAQTGTVSGNVGLNAAAGVYTFTVAKANPAIGQGEQCFVGVSGKMASQQLRVFSITVSASDIVFTGETEKTVAANQSFVLDASVQAGESVAYAFTNPETVPAGVGIDADSGKVYGSVASAGVYDFTVTATTATKGSLEIPVTIYVGGLSFAGGTLTEGYADLPYADSVANAQLINVPAGTAANVSYSVVGGSLPEGMRLSANGILSGTAAREGAYTFTVRADAGRYGIREATYTIEIKSSLSLKGDDGEKGETGAAGEKGEPGAQGQQGLAGKDASAVTGIVGMTLGIVGICAGAAALVLVFMKKKKA